jgi:hypothetical protein
VQYRPEGVPVACAPFAVLLDLTGRLLAACMGDNCAMESDLEAGPPDKATLCKLKPGKTTLNEAEALLGTPAGQSSMRDSVAVLAYSYSGAALTLPFTDGVLSMPTVVGISYPDCWTTK